MRLSWFVPVVAVTLLTSCGGRTLRIESDTSWTGTVGGIPVSGHGSLDMELPARNGGRGAVCWDIRKTSEAGTLRAHVEQSTFFGLGSVVEGEMTTTAPFGVVAGCAP